MYMKHARLGNANANANASTNANSIASFQGCIPRAAIKLLVHNKRCALVQTLAEMAINTQEMAEICMASLLGKLSRSDGSE